ncbi:MAG: DUF4430 domain-containing protein [Candidatus Lokiarchaeota archaeon]|nr:DUF4430 domain-containing protein [Candidatus Harpocratesius repetitus]
MESKGKSKNIKNILILSFFFFIVISLSFILPSILQNDENIEEKSKNSIIKYDPLLHFRNISLTVDFNNGTIDIHKNLTIWKNSSTVYDLLTIFYKVGYDSYSFGIIITSIEGKKNDVNANTFWFFWVNEEYSMLGASSVYLNDSDSVFWAYRNANEVQDFKF